MGDSQFAVYYYYYYYYYYIHIEFWAEAPGGRGGQA
jgi:hypothetical protein